jgi:hypothetical protein
MIVFALLGAKALYLLYAWLLSGRKGYGERLGLASGLLLLVIGILIFLVLPARPESAWAQDGPLPRRRVKAER